MIVPGSQTQISSNQGAPPSSGTNATSHSNYFIQSSAAATAATMMLNGNTGQSSQMQTASSASQPSQGQSQQSQYSGQKGGSAVGQGQVLVQQPNSQLNHQSGYKPVVISNMGKTGGMPAAMQMQQMSQLNSGLPSEFSQIMQNIVVPSMP